eukprot:CAMPEP_0118883488 /NCGR_PEP_ID=MMETSP1163-20130328/22553_1 /TAXON_ID=124430 /ORGANISM="Phaeomonas parva, Strain CCMP2877" /LENGTH=272 /DNA_ID=CAMNT_0006820909 /DNA_START=141 /DNA_END=959 /DNA_ORIENTATION=+
MPPSPSPLMGGTKTCEHVLGGTAAVRRAPGSDMATLSETHVESAEPFAGKPAARHMSSNVAAQMQPANAAAAGAAIDLPADDRGEPVRRGHRAQDREAAPGGRHDPPTAPAEQLRVRAPVGQCPRARAVRITRHSLMFAGRGELAPREILISGGAAPAGPPMRKGGASEPLHPARIATRSRLAHRGCRRPRREPDPLRRADPDSKAFSGSKQTFRRGAPFAPHNAPFDGVSRGGPQDGRASPAPRVPQRPPQGQPPQLSGAPRLHRGGDEKG